MAGNLVYLVEAENDQQDRLERELPEWQWSTLSSTTEAEQVASESRNAVAMILFAKKDSEKEVLQACKHIKEQPNTRDLPLLVAISIYQMPLANDIKRLPHAHFVFTPLRAEEVRDRIEAMTA